MTSELDRGKRRQIIKHCLEIRKMDNSEARQTVISEMKLDSYPWRTYYYDLSLIRKGYKEQIKLLVQEGTFEYFWSTVASLKKQISGLNDLAKTADSDMARIAARNSIVQAELILLQLVSNQNIAALEKLRLETKIIDIPPGVEPPNESNPESGTNETAN